jgi:hypothetical protein
VEYEDLARSYLDEVYPHPNVFRTVCPSWDQTARVGSRAFIALNGTPANYEYWLKETVQQTAQDFPEQERFVFINAWNEWAEGCHLEPDRRFQRQFLEATLRVKQNRSAKESFDDKGVPKPIEPLTSTASKLNDVQQELAIVKRHRAEAQNELTEERQRLSAVYRDVEAKLKQISHLEQEISEARGNLADLQKELSSERQAASTLSGELTLQTQTISTLEEALSTAKHELSVTKKELDTVQKSLAWRIARRFT